MMTYAQSLTHREVRTPGMFVKNTNAKMPAPGQFNPDLIWQVQTTRTFEPEPQQLTVPNQLPCPANIPWP